jgi:hypothetical protein
LFLPLPLPDLRARFPQKNSKSKENSTPEKATSKNHVRYINHHKSATKTPSKKHPPLFAHSPQKPQ